MILCNCEGKFPSGRVCGSIQLGGVCGEGLEVGCEHQLDGVEVWKAIEGWEGIYEVSCLGRVRSLDRVVPVGLWSERKVEKRILKPIHHHHNSLTVKLSYEGAYDCVMISRLVWAAFIGLPVPKYIQHKDCNLTMRDRLDNLRRVDDGCNCDK